MFTAIINYFHLIMKKTIIPAFIAIFLVLILTGCHKKHFVVVKSSNDEWGIVTGSGTYYDGETAILTAIPTDGYYFLGWDDGDTTNPRSLIVNNDATFTAIFSDTPFGIFDGKPIQISGNICNDQIWQDLGLDVDYIIDETVYIGCDATVKVMPGVTIMFTGPEGNLEVIDNGALTMIGTMENPIILRGPDVNSSIGYWGHVVVNTTRPENKFQWVNFIHGGSNSDLHYGVLNLRGTLSMIACTIDGSYGTGLVTENGSYFTQLDGNRIVNCQGYPWVSSSFPALYKNIGANALYNFDEPYGKIYVDLDRYEINDDVTLKSEALERFYFPHGFSFEGTGTLTFYGASSFVGEGRQLRVGKNLNFRAKSMFFAGLSSSIRWDGLIFESERSNNQLNNVWFSNCGAFCLKVTKNAKLSITSCRLGPCVEGAGVWIENIETWGNVSHHNIEDTYCNHIAHIEHGGTYNDQTYQDNTDLDYLP